MPTLYSLTRKGKRGVLRTLAADQVFMDGDGTDIIVRAGEQVLELDKHVVTIGTGVAVETVAVIMTGGGARCVVTLGSLVLMGRA